MLARPYACLCCAKVPGICSSSIASAVLPKLERHPAPLCDVGTPVGALILLVLLCRMQVSKDQALATLQGLGTQQQQAQQQQPQQYQRPQLQELSSSSGPRVRLLERPQ